jgi:hypothetical protein
MLTFHASISSVERAESTAQRERSNFMPHSVAVDSPARAQTSSPWIQSPAWDARWIFSGLWAPLLAVIAYVILNRGAAQSFASAPAFHQQHFVLLFTALALLHRLSSIHAVLISPIMRSEMRANPARYIRMPILIVIATLLLAQAFVFNPAFAFMGSERGQLWAFFVLAMILIAWDRWHFCMQEFGVLSIYRTRVGQSAPRDRRFDRVYVVMLMLVVNSVLYLYAGFEDDRQLLWLGTPLASLHGDPLRLAGQAACACGVTLMTVAIVRELRHPRRSWPKLAYYALIGSHSLVLYLVPSALSLFFLSYVFHHWLVAIALFNRITLNSYTEQSRRQRVSSYLLRVGPWFVGCLVLGMFFQPLDLTVNLTPIPKLSMFAGAGGPARAAAGLVIGGIFSFSFLHYYYDRCLYSFSSPGVRRAVGPLLLGASPPSAAEAGSEKATGARSAPSLRSPGADRAHPSAGG